MGRVTDTLIQTLREQIKECGTVVWYDPNHRYSDVVPTLTSDQIENAALYVYKPEEGFFWLRHELESHWASLDLSGAPRLLIYVPLAHSDSHYALVEYEKGGIVVQPGQQPLECNTALSAITRKALTGIFPTARLEEIVNEVQAGKLSLAELDKLAERGSEAQTGTLAVIFGTGNATEIVLHFLSHADVDDRIAARHGEADIAKLLSETLGLDLTGLKESRELRAQAARLILATDFIEALGEARPDSFKTFALAQQPIARQAAVELARQWRNRADLVASYIKLSETIQTELGIRSLALGYEALAQMETFSAAEARLQTLIEEALLKRPSVALLELVQTRIGGFWSHQEPGIKMRWEVILNAGRVLQDALRIESGLKGKPSSAGKLFADYAYGETPWCTLDTAYRHLERDIHRYDVDLQNRDALNRLVEKASNEYSRIVNHLAEQFVRAYRDEKFELTDVQLQADIYRDFVKEALRTKRVAYILIDAFRFEMAREFSQVLQSTQTDWRWDLTPALATPPTITAVGMAALMPGAENGITLQAGKETIVPIIEGQAIRTAKERHALLSKALGEPVPVITLDDIAPLRKTNIIKDLKSRLVVITASDDIDGVGENMPKKAPRSINDILGLLRRGLSALFHAGFQEIVITADHGFILSKSLDDSQKIESPKGKQVALKRRVWIGKGGSEHAAVMRTPLSAFGIGGDLELATPFGLAIFKAGGGTEYFHGGLALQELVIPVMTVSSASAASEDTDGEWTWALTLGSHKITSPFVSISVEGKLSTLLPAEPPIIRVEIRDSQQALSVPMTAAYGFQEVTKDVKLAMKTAQEIEKNPVTLWISGKVTTSTVDVYLLDAKTGKVLHQQSVEISLPD